MVALLAVILAGDLQPPPRAAPDEEVIAATIRSMTPREQIAQLLFVGFQGTAMSADLERMVRDWRVGGVIFYAPNIQSPAQAAKLTAAIRQAGGDGWNNPFLAADQEGGTVVRLALPAAIPSAMAVGATASPGLARRGAAAIGAALREAGFSLNFGPVLDVGSGRNPSLDRRRFGGDVELVTALGTASIAGLRDAGLVAVAKHFPGHGQAAEDAHVTLPLNPAPAPIVRQRDLAPFRAAIAAGLEAIMTAHIRLPAIAENDRVPATMSHRVMTGILRGELGFDGVIISDEIRMKALAGVAEPPEAAVASLLAGADMILVASFPREREEILNALLTARAEGRLSSARIEASLRRILRLKYRMAQRRHSPLAPRDDAALEEIAARAVTLTGNSGCLVPIRPDLGPRLLYIGPARAASDALQEASRVTWTSAPAKDTEAQIVSALRRQPALLVFAAETEKDLALARRVRSLAPQVPLVLLWSGDPYALHDGSAANATILTYGRHPRSVHRAMQILVGEAVAEGRLPVQITARFEGQNRCADTRSSASMNLPPVATCRPLPELCDMASRRTPSA